ncbi:MAG: hypothetical protein QGH12_06540 [SAR324 cluster bacterium]|nr:hypothetical protein [SAR324 cluster bacterium]
MKSIGVVFGCGFGNPPDYSGDGTNPQGGARTVLSATAVDFDQVVQGCFEQQPSLSGDELGELA